MENRAYVPEQIYLEKLEKSNMYLLPPESSVPKFGRKIVQYELDFDREQARELLTSKYTEGYESRVENFKSFTEMQLITALGERFNRGLSKYTYKMEEGVLYGEHSEEPFLNVLERGRLYRQIHGNSVDHKREEAEVIGFEKIQEYMKDAEEGATAISISQPGGEGSIYKHNFYDVFQKNREGNIDVIRFSNANNAEETVEKLVDIDPTIDIPSDLSSEHLLANPIILSSDTPHDLDKIHAQIHKEHSVMNEKDFQVIKEMCAFLIVSYINAVLEDPDDTYTHARLYNAIFNKADEIADALKEDTMQTVQSSAEMTLEQIYYLGEQKVREVDTGCGFSGGAGLVGESANGPFSVADYGVGGRFSTEIKDEYGGLEFPCPYEDCKKINKRPYGKLIKTCGEGQIGGCGRDVTC